MQTKIYVNNEYFIAGITLKDESELECNNMALHVCENTEHILTNRRKLANLLHCQLSDFVCANQTHSANFFKVTDTEKGKGANSFITGIADTDALYTFEPNTVLCTFTADCVPVFIWDERQGVAGVIHSGWQGTVKEITRKTLQHLIHNEHCNPENLHILLGPALSQERFEVDEDVYNRFQQLGYADEFTYFNADTRKYHIDNQLTIKRQCELVGIPNEQISIDQTCTFLSPEGFSYRQNKKSGRHLSFIMKKRVFHHKKSHFESY